MINFDQDLEGIVYAGQKIPKSMDQADPVRRMTLLAAAGGDIFAIGDDENSTRVIANFSEKINDLAYWCGNLHACLPSGIYDVTTKGFISTVIRPDQLTVRANNRYFLIRHTGRAYKLAPDMSYKRVSDLDDWVTALGTYHITRKKSGVAYLTRAHELRDANSNFRIAQAKLDQEVDVTSFVYKKKEWLGIQDRDNVLMRMRDNKEMLSGLLDATAVAYHDKKAYFGADSGEICEAGLNPVKVAELGKSVSALLSCPNSIIEKVIQK